MTNGALRVLLVEDSPLLAERLREVLAQTAGIDVVGTVDTEAAAVHFLRTQVVDVLILDLQLRQGTGFGVLRSLAGSRTRTIVLTNYALPAYQLRAHQLGAEHFLDKSRDVERLPEIFGSLNDVLH